MCLALQLICNSCGEYCAPFIDYRVTCTDKENCKDRNVKGLTVFGANFDDLELFDLQIRGFHCPAIQYEMRKTNLEDEDEKDWQCWACRYHSFFMYHEDNPMNHKTLDPEGKLLDWVYLVRNDKPKLKKMANELFAEAREHATYETTLMDPCKKHPDKENILHRISMMKMLMNFYWIGDMPAVL